MELPSEFARYEAALLVRSWLRSYGALRPSMGAVLDTKWYRDRAWARALTAKSARALTAH